MSVHVCECVHAYFLANYNKILAYANPLKVYFPTTPTTGFICAEAELLAESLTLQISSPYYQTYLICIRSVEFKKRLL